MADIKRKVLINRHTSGSSAPVADSMYLGEIAVAHETGKETLFTKNNDNKMVPFISCGQTIAIIESKIKAADVSYDVKAKEGETFINVERGANGSAVTFTLSSEDIQSKKAFDAYSSKTTNALDTLTQSFKDLLDVTLTAGTGDGIINVSTVGTGTDASANTFSVTHAKAPKAITAGFNKLATDDYGHVTGATAVETADIEKLGFKTSTATTAEITAVIEALDSEAKVTTGKYLTGIAIADGKISGFTEAELPKLSSATTGDGNVVTDIQVTDHEITFVKGMTVASDADLKAVSGIVNTFSAATEAKFADTDTAIETLSGNVVNYVKSVSGNIESVINAMDKDASAADGQVVTTVSQVDGKVSEAKAYVKDLQLGGYVKDASARGDIAGTDTINAALSKLENVIGANKITNSDKSIVVTAPTGEAATTDIKVNIKSGENVIKLGDNGLYTDIKIAKINSSSDLVKDEYVLYGTDGKSQLGESIKIYKDQSLVSITLVDNDGSGKTGQYLKYTYIDASGKTQSTYVNVSSLLSEAEFADGLKVDGSGVVHGVVDSTSETFLTVGADGFKLSGVQAAIDAAKASATTKVAKDAAATHLTLSSTTADDGSVTYTIGESDIASKAALDAEIAARKAVDGQGDTYAKNTSANYIAEATSLNDADIKLDAAIKAEENARTSQDNKIEESIGLAEDGSHVTTNGTYTSAATTVVGEIAALDKALKEVSAVVDGLDYAGLTNENTKVVTDVKQENGLVSANATAVGDLVITTITTSVGKVAASDSLATIAGKLQGQIDAMDSTGTTSGDGYFLTSIQIADGKITAVTQSDKVNSASTAESADKVVNALTMRDATNSQAFDGSVARSLIFGTSVTATGLTDRSSMSMTSGGVVDVEIIDCGTY